MVKGVRLVEPVDGDLGLELGHDITFIESMTGILTAVVIAHGQLTFWTLEIARHL